MASVEKAVDVLCVGHASYDLVFSVPAHPLADEKIFADGFLACSGGPAANASVIVARLGFSAAFAGYLGNDLYGQSHAEELKQEGVDLSLVVRGSDPTPLSCVLVKPDGFRALVNYKGATKHLPPDSIGLAGMRPKVVLFDGHEPLVSVPLAERIQAEGTVVTVLDAGSLHPGTEALMTRVEYLVASEKFARQLTGCNDMGQALSQMSGLAYAVVITLGEKGLIWRKQKEHGQLSAFAVQAVDTTGAGDAFHGAFAAGLAQNFAWPELLTFASAAGSLCCQRQGARPGLATFAEIQQFLARQWAANKKNS